MSLLRPLSRSTLSPLLQAAKRSYATASGVKVAAVDLGQPTTSVTVVVKAGSRFETQPGVAHVLKNFAFKSTSSGSSLKTIRETELYGGVLSSSISREHLFLTAEFLRGDEDYFLSLLSSVLSSSKFSTHEYNELVLPTIQSDSIVASSTPSVLAFDLAHTLAFRKGLGNSLFASPHSPVTSEEVKSFADKAFAKSNIAVIGSGISEEALSSAVTKAFGGSSTSGGSELTSPATKYFGGETRVALDSHASPTALPTLLIAYGTTSPSPELSVLSSYLGGSSSLKWVPGTSPLSLAAAKIPGSSAQAFNLQYSDAGLVGVLVTAQTSAQVKELAGEVASILKSAGKEISEEEVKRAVGKAKFDKAAAVEGKEGLIAVAGPELLSSGSITSLTSSIDALSKVSASSLSKSSAELFKGKPTIVAIGDLTVLPYGDELGL